MTVLADAPARPGPSPDPADALPGARGALSESVIEFLTGRSRRLWPSRPTATLDAHPDDGDVQLALWVLNVTQVAGFAGVLPDRVGSLPIRTLHWELEQVFEAELRRLAPVAVPTDLLRHLHELIERPGSGAGTTPTTVRCRFVGKAPYVGWEADPHTLALARVEAPLKAPLVDIQSGEYGLGHAQTHAQVYRSCLVALGLDVIEAVDRAPAAALAFANAAWLFGRHHHLRGAAVGQLSLLELDSVRPCQQAKEAWDAAGLPAQGRRWYDIHALADVEHAAVITEQVIPTLEAATPWLLADAAWGAEVTWVLQDRMAQRCDEATGALDGSGPSRAGILQPPIG